MTDTLYVRMGQAQVGTLLRTRGEFVFSYAQSWLDGDAPTPISHSMPLSTQPYQGKLVESYFDNLLPDDEGVRRRMERVLGAASSRVFDLLAEAGRDCVGALQLVRDSRAAHATQLSAEPLTDAQIGELLSQLGEGRPLGMRSDDDFRISVAGMQDKTALLWWRKRWHRPEGATPTSHILKLADGRKGLHDSIENEWLCMQLIRRFGLQTASVQVQAFSGVRALVVERFDRKWSKDGRWLERVAQEDGCQALGVGPQRKYESDGGPGIEEMMNLLWSAHDPVEARETFFKAQFVFWLLAAIDGHAKNFSVFLRPGGRLELCPLYDVLSAYPLLERKVLARQKLKMAMALRAKNAHYHWREFSRARWLATAKRCRFDKKRAEQIIDDCLARVEPAISDVEATLPTSIPTDLAQILFAGLRSARDSFS